MAISQECDEKFLSLLQFPYERFSDFEADWQKYQEETGSLFFRKRTESASYIRAIQREELPPEQPYKMIEFWCVHSKSWRNQVKRQYRDYNCPAIVRVRCKDGFLTCTVVNTMHSHPLGPGSRKLYARCQRLNENEENAMKDVLNSFNHSGEMRQWVREKFGKSLTHSQAKFLRRKIKGTTKVQDETSGPTFGDASKPGPSTTAPASLPDDGLEHLAAGIPNEDHPVSVEATISELDHDDDMSPDERLAYFLRITRHLYGVLSDMPKSLFVRRCSQLKKFARWVHQQKDFGSQCPMPNNGSFVLSDSRAKRTRLVQSTAIPSTSLTRTTNPQSIMTINNGSNSISARSNPVLISSVQDNSHQDELLGWSTGDDTDLFISSSSDDSDEEYNLWYH